MTEIWTPIRTHPTYQISTHGRVRNASKRILDPKARPDGYIRVTLCDEGIASQFMVHRLVADHFGVKGAKKPVIHHIDGKRANNTSGNLDHVTTAENTQKKVFPNYGRRIRPVVQLRSGGSYVKTWESIVEAAASLSLSRGNISACCRGKHRLIGGYGWKYLDEYAPPDTGEEWRSFRSKGAECEVSSYGRIRTKTGV